jgi:dienelactone hydrolase
MIGQTISHYKIVESLGGGGMGVVYKATDLRLNRFVALKFLSSDLTRDRDANLRFRQEAQAASALDHPNICTIHEIDETPSGELFLTMAYYEGETLKSRMARGKIDVRDAIDWAIQAARGLARAHQSKIVHRDVKPANLILSTDGTLKILDFGLAKLTGQQDVTRTGTVLGTVAYMSPEQARGDLVDARTDIWSLGVVIYEMLAGRRPFEGESDVATLSRILQDVPPPLGTLRPDAPAALQQIVAKTLERHPDARYAGAEDLLADLQACKAALDKPAAAGKGLMSPVGRRAMIAAAVIVALSIAIPGYFTYRRIARERWARNEAIPRIDQLTSAGDYLGAMELAKQAGAVLPTDPILGALWGQFAVTAVVNTSPAGADVYVQPYAAAGERWEHLGRTPLAGLRLARAAYRLRIEKDGYEPVVVAARAPGTPFTGIFARGGVPLPPATVELVAKGSAPGMVRVMGGSFPLGLTGFNVDQDLDMAPFLIDRLETTNREYQAFVRAGGYRDLSAAFVDSTGKPGPSTWELGDFPAGHPDDPVGGLSWNEAAAYCKWAGKSLPTIFHWGRAALALVEIGQPIAPSVIPASNFSGKSVAPVGTYRGLGPYGTLDMAGNVSEWVWNEAPGDRRWILGGAWNDPDYFFTVPNSRPPLDRSAANGVRCAKYQDASVERGPLMARVVTEARDFHTAKAVPDEVFAYFKRLYAPITSPLNARVESKNDVNADWSREVLTFDAGYEPGRVAAYLFLPKNAAPPYQLVVSFPGVGPFVTAGSNAQNSGALLDYFMRGGRAVVMPNFKGSYERWDPFLSLVGEEYLRTMRARMGQWRQDLGRTLDMLAARKDIDLTRVAYNGSSFGASTAFPLILLEDRIKVAVLSPSGFTYRSMPDEADAVNYVGRVKIPVLMMGGRHDYIFPLETSQKPMFDRLGTPASDKRQLTFEAGHGAFPRGDVIREVQAWLDKYLGPVTAKRSP